MSDNNERSRVRTVKAGHLPIGELTSPLSAASSPFGEAHFPLPVDELNYEHADPQPVRVDRPSS